MGYSCPVCGDPQADGVHLANHLAITAMVRGGDHEAWLDDQLPEWSQLGEAELAGKLTESAEKAEYPAVFESTTAHGRGGGHDHGHGEGHSHEEQRPGHSGGNEGRSREQVDEQLPPGTSVPDPSLGENASDILKEAQELTRKRRETGKKAGTDSAGDSTSDSETE